MRSWEDLGSHGKIWEEGMIWEGYGRFGKTWEDMGRSGKIWEDLGRHQAVVLLGSKSVANYRVNYWLVQPEIGDFCPIQSKKSQHVLRIFYLQNGDFQSIW